MAPITAHQSSISTKMLLIGDSGSGKTCSIFSLAEAGYNVRILDLDNGLDALASLLQAKPEAAARVNFETLTDPMKKVGTKLIPKAATVWQRALSLLDNWKIPEGDNFGPLITWTPKEVLVIDSLTFLSNAAMQLVLMMNGRLGQKPHQSDWYEGQQMIESLLQMLYDESVKCNIILTSHIAYIGEEGQQQIGYPASLGKSLSPRIGRYFNTILQTRTSGQGTNAKKVISTTTTGLIELKNSAPLRVAKEYPLSTGLADYFKAAQNAPQ